MAGLWDALVDCICRPPRDSYQEADLLGGVKKKFRINIHGGGQFKAIREDLVITNKKGQKIQCSHFLPAVNRGKDGRLPCVVYCHCNSGSKRDGEEAAWLLLPSGMSVFTFDFTGSGLSDGDWVTLGANEVDDLEAVVTHLRESNKCSTLGLWGRSMGAVTALLYSKRDPSIGGMVLDSPFSCLTQLMLEVVEEQKLPIPKAVTKMVLGAMRKSVKKRAGFDINDVTPLDIVKESFIPAVFGHGEQDTFIKIHHTEKLFEAYAGDDKKLERFDGDHNARRPDFFNDSVAIFLHNALRVNELVDEVSPHDRAAVRQRASQSHRLPGQSSSGGRLPSQTSTPLAAQAAMPTASSEDLADAEDLDAEELMLQQVLALSLMEAESTAAAQATPNSAAATPAPAPSAPPAEDDDDAQLRAAIELSLRDAQPASLSAASPGMQPGTLQQTTPAVKPPAGNIREQQSSNVDAT